MKNSVKRVLFAVIAAAYVSILSSALVLPHRVSAAATAVNAGADITVPIGQETPLTGISFTGTGTIPVTLRVTGGSLSMTVTTGLTFSTDTEDVLVMSFTGDVADVNTALQSLTYTRFEGPGTDTLEVSSLETGEVFYAGHIYEYIDADGIDWTAAETAAAGLSKYGETGYLATITSAEENEYISERLLGDGWIGASDAGVEGEWEWVTGPEAGTDFWLGADDGAPVSGRYNAWAGSEPNDSGSDEDCGQLYVEGGSWNDLPCVGHTLEGYVVEYGDTSPIGVVTDSRIITAIAETITIDSCQDLQDLDQYSTSYDTLVLANDIDCLGIDFYPLYEDEDFSGEFNGQGYSIYNLTIDQPEMSDVGIFSKTNEGSYIHDLTLASGSVTGSGDVGALIGEVEEGTRVESVVSHVNVSGVDGASSVGGLIGYVDEDYNDPGEVSGWVRDSGSRGDVTGGSRVGGLIGRVVVSGQSSFAVERSFATGTIFAESYEAGGLVGSVIAEGWDDGVTVLFRDVYAWGATSGGDSSENIGGLIGYAEAYDDGGPATLTIENAYAAGNAIGYSYVGGLIGYAYGVYGTAEFNLENSFATGAVTATSGNNHGAVIGYYELGDTPIASDNIYFDETGTGLEDCAGNETLSDCSAVNSAGAQPAYFINNNTEPPMNEWNFSTIWVKNPGLHPTFAAISYDNDGITSVTENAAPNNGDGNGDGVLDSLQTHVSSLPNAVVGGGSYLTLEIADDEDCSTISSVAQATETTLGTDTAYDYPVGLTDFSVSCTLPGGSTTISLYYDRQYDTTGWVARKHVNGVYRAVPGALFESRVVGTSTVTVLTYSVTDGGELDEDGTANGIILDPAGPAVLAATASVGAPNTGMRPDTNPLLLVSASLIVLSMLCVQSVLDSRQR